MPRKHFFSLKIFKFCKKKCIQYGAQQEYGAELEKKTDKQQICRRKISPRCVYKTRRKLFRETKWLRAKSAHSLSRDKKKPRKKQIDQIYRDRII